MLVTTLRLPPRTARPGGFAACFGPSGRGGAMPAHAVAIVEIENILKGRIGFYRRFHGEEKTAISTREQAGLPPTVEIARPESPIHRCLDPKQIIHWDAEQLVVKPTDHSVASPQMNGALRRTFTPGDAVRYPPPARALSMEMVQPARWSTYAASSRPNAPGSWPTTQPFIPSATAACHASFSPIRRGLRR